jgi:hypothetical protein
MRKTFGRLASVADAARLAKIDTKALIDYLQKHLAGGAAGPGQAGSPVPVQGISRETGGDYRVDELKAMLRELHAGRTPEEVAARFGRLLEAVKATKTAEAEQQLVAEGLPEDEIKRLCDVHAAVFRGAPQQQVGLDLPSEHPLTGLPRRTRTFRPSWQQKRWP